MKKFAVLVPAGLLLASCVHTPFEVAVDCPEPGLTNVNISYGDSQLKVTPPIVKVKLGSMLRFNLQPDKKPTDPTGVDYDYVAVTIKGKTAEARQWLYVSGTHNLEGNLTVCAPEGDNKVGVYEYLVKVDKVGELDPRADVEKIGFQDPDKRSSAQAG